MGSAWTDSRHAAYIMSRGPRQACRGAALFLGDAWRRAGPYSRGDILSARARRRFAEATYQAEVVLKDEPLQAYLDDVALKGLRLAEHDRERGILDDDSLNRIETATRELMENLAEFEPRRWFRKVTPEKAKDEVTNQTGLAALATHEESEEGLPVVDPAELAPGWEEPNAILCIGTRTPLDDAAAVMLAGLLEKHGLEPNRSSMRQFRRGDHFARSECQAGLPFLSQPRRQ